MRRQKVEHGSTRFSLNHPLLSKIVVKLLLIFHCYNFKVRMKEMEKTRDWAQELTQSAHGKHHIGDFLPPDELAKFMEKVSIMLK